MRGFHASGGRGTRRAIHEATRRLTAWRWGVNKALLAVYVIAISGGCNQPPSEDAGSQTVAVHLRSVK
jgi:hypothetical protein